MSAFSNYDGGEILYGVDDDGNIKVLTLVIWHICHIMIMEENEWHLLSL